jgi:hypothetical protein
MNPKTKDIPPYTPEELAEWMKFVLTPDECDTIRQLPEAFLTPLYENNIKYGPQGDCIASILTEITEEYNPTKRFRIKNAVEADESKMRDRLWDELSSVEIADDLAKRKGQMSYLGEVLGDIVKDHQVRYDLQTALLALMFRDLIWQETSDSANTFSSAFQWANYFQLTERLRGLVSGLPSEDKDIILTRLPYTGVERIHKS